MGNWAIKLQAFLYFIFLPVLLPAQTSLIISNTSQLQYAENNIYHLIDSIGALSFGEVQKLPDSTFVFEQKSGMSYGNSHTTWWFKFHLENVTKENLFLLFQNQELKNVDVFIVDKKGNVDSVNTGLLQPVENRFFNTNTLVVNIGLQPQTIYLRIQSTIMYVPVLAGTIQPIVKRIHEIDLATMLILGIMLALAIYNFVIWFFVKDRLHLYYSLFISSSVFVAAHARNYLDYKYSLNPNFAATLIVLFSTLFAIDYLGTKMRSPRLHKLIVFWTGLGIVLLPINLLPYQGWHNDIYQLMHILHMPLILGTGLYVYIKGYKPALFFVLAYFLFTAGVVVILTAFMGFLPMTNIWVYSAYHIGSALEALILSFAVAYRFNLYKKEAHEKELQLVRERSRIMADLHDDIGASLSSMSIYSDLAGEVIENKPGESKVLVDKISGTSKELMERMGDIIWSMKPADEDKYTVEARLKNYCNELLAPKNIVCEFDIDATLAASTTNPEIRKNILLIAKEAINNIAKYSVATKAVIQFKQNGKGILLSISDNGKGYDKEKIKYGNGIQNIQQRCRQLNGHCNISSQNGVLIECFLPLGILK